MTEGNRKIGTLNKLKRKQEKQVRMCHKKEQQLKNRLRRDDDDETTSQACRQIAFFFISLHENMALPACHLRVARNSRQESYYQNYCNYTQPQRPFKFVSFRDDIQSLITIQALVEQSQVGLEKPACNRPIKAVLRLANLITRLYMNSDYRSYSLDSKKWVRCRLCKMKSNLSIIIR